MNGKAFRIACRLVSLGVLGICVGPPRSLGAQDPGPEAARLTLEEAMSRAYSQNPRYESALTNLELNRIEAREYWLSLLPQPQLHFLRTNMQWNRATIGTDNFGNPIPNPDVRMVQTARSDQFGSLTLQVDFADLYRRRIVGLEADLREVAVDRAAQTLASDVRAAFIDAQEMLATRGLEERLIEIQRVNRDITERLFRLADVGRPELLSAELDYVEQESRLSATRSALETAMLRLESLTADAEVRSREVAPTPLRVFDPDGLAADALVTAALESGPVVRDAALGVEVAERNVSLRQAAWLPTLTLSATTGRRQLSRDSSGGFLQLTPAGEWDRAFGLTLALPDLGAYFSRRAGVRRQEVELRNAAAALREARLQVEANVRGLILELRTQYRIVDVEDRRAELAEDQLELQQERYRLGQIDYLELQSSVRSLSDAERRSLEARYAFERALIELERVTGGPLEMPADG